MSDQKKLLKRALEAIDSLTGELDAARASEREPIAVVGMSCRFPGNVDSPDDYWKLLREGASGIVDIPSERWDVDAFYDPDPEHPGTMTTRRGGFVRGLEGFDAPFFRISPREAATLDPQHRLLLECTWKALEDAGEAPDGLIGSQTGVFVGITASDYARLLRIGREDSDVYSATGTALNGASGRISFFLGLQGPCMAIDTACSSSLVATHIACQSLRAGECERALVGGVNTILSPEPFILFSKWGMLATSGECRAFDEGASGFVRGEGCGVLVLKRLSDAQAAGDPIHAVILGSAVNQDGPGSGLSVPNGPAQVKAIRAALERADLAPEEVSFIEAHGTGTPIGDPIEVEALGEAYGPGHADDPLYIGSVKPSIGHLESAAGVASLMKLILSVREGELPPQRCYERPNPRIEWDRIPVRVVEQLSPWPQGKRRVGAVSGFGFTGTNVHMLVGEAPPRAALEETARARHLLPISAQTPAGLRQLAAELADVLDGFDPASLVDVERTLMSGRARFATRGAVVGVDAAGLAAELRALGEGRSSGGATSGVVESGRPAPPVFLYTGQGSQYPGMGRQLHDAYPAFRDAFDRCLTIVEEVGGPDLMGVLSGDDREAVHQTAITQPALFALEYSLTELLDSWGIRPAAVLGHSIGELVAACVAGVFSLEDALALTVARGRLMQELPPGGGMLAVSADAAQCLEVLEPYRDRAALAAHNGPGAVVLSGGLDALDDIAAVLERRDVKTKKLTVSHAFHSPLMEPMQEAWLEALSKVDLRAPRIPLVSNLSGTIDAQAGATAEYWARHVREPVAFEPSMRTLVEEGHRTFLEVGPRPVLLGMARRFLDLEGAAWIPTLRGRGDEAGDVLLGLAELFSAGQRPDWEGLLRGAGRSTRLPTYPFQRKPHWAAARPTPGPASSAASSNTGHPLLGRLIRSPVADQQFECALEPRSNALLREHRVAGKTVFPAAGYIELARAAGGVLQDGGAVRLERLVFKNALILDGHQGDTDRSSPDVRLVVSPARNDSMDFEIFGRAAAAASRDPWTSHAAGRISTAGPSCDPVPEAAILERCSEQVDIDAYRERIAAVGLEYGPTFLSLVDARRTDGEAYGVVRLPEGSAGGGFGIHPGLLDAAFHLIGLAHSDDGDDRFLLPVSIDAVDVHATGGDELRVHCTVIEATATAVRVDLRLQRPDGTPVADIRGLETRPISRDQFSAAIARDAVVPLLDLAWRPWQPDQPAPAQPEEWLVLAGVDRELADEVAGALAEAGARSRVVAPDEQGGTVVIAEGDSEAKSIVDLRALDVPDTVAALELLRSLAENAPAAGIRLFLLTRGGERVDAEDRVDPAASALWGIGATAAAELPGVEVTLVDVGEEPAVDGAALAKAMLGKGDESRIAQRDNRWFVARLAPVAPPEATPYALTLRSRGDFSGLALAAAERLEPGRGGVEIEVFASGLNFRDVLNALDMYPGDPGPLGNECCGRVLSVGADVEDLRTGDLVTCIAEGTFGSHVIARQEMVFPVPAELSIAQAAVFPIAYLTAHLALCHLGDMKRGDRVLIHAAAGGVGLAAVALAQAAGAEVYATAGSEEKRAFLRELGVREVWDSRQTLSHETVREATGGDGVDLLLNALTGPSIDEGIRSLAEGGRFLEIGLRELRSDEEVAAIRDDVRYEAILLGDWCKDQPDTVRELWAKLLELLRAGELAPPRVHRFPLDSVDDAFRFMARARHIGRIAIVHEHASAPWIRDDAAYLVSGGLGALGLHTAEWLVGRGARELLLLGRREPDEAAAEWIAALEAEGASVHVIAGDVAEITAGDLAGGPEQAPIRGVFHAAGVTDDATLARLDAVRLRRVWAPKAEGALRLIEATRHTDLDHLVFFSSGSALLGSPGQAAYTAANRFLDGLAGRLQAEGRAAVSIGWGAWQGSGMVEKVDARTREQWTAAGIGTLPPASALDALAQAMRRARPTVAVLPIQWSRLTATMERIPSLLRDLVARGVSTDDGSERGEALDGLISEPTFAGLRLDLEGLTGPARDAALREYLCARLGGILRIAPEEIDLELGVNRLGFDSLMALEAKNLIETDLGVVLSMARLLDGPSIIELTEELVVRLDVSSLAAGAAGEADGERESVDL